MATQNCYLYSLVQNVKENILRVIYLGLDKTEGL